MAFSATESAFEGFRIIKREPATVVVWAVLLLVLSAAASALLLPVLGQFRGGVTSGATAVSPAQLAALGSFMRLYLILLPAYLIVVAVFTAAIYRAVLRPTETGFGRLRFGGDELRLIGLFVLMGLFFFVVFLLVGVVAGLAVGGAIAATRSGGAAGAVLTVTLLYLVLIIAGAWLAVRFSLAAPMTFGERRIRLFGSWRLTKGRFWPLLGCYLLAWVFMILVLLVDMAVSGVLMLGAAGGSFTRVASAMFRPDVTSAMGVLSPIYIVRLVVGAAFGVVMWTVGLAPQAAAYRAIAAPRPEDQADAFA
jgi:hypothetical protein